MPVTDRDGTGRDGAVVRSTVLLVDDHPLTRDGLRNLLSAEADLEVCGEADSVAGARWLAGKLRPDLVILDLDLPDGDAFALLTELRSQPEPPRVMVLAGNGRADGEAERALRLGASAFISKRAYGDELLRAARSAVAGHVVLGDDLIQRLVRQRAGDGRSAVRRRVAR